MCWQAKNVIVLSDPLWVNYSIKLYRHISSILIWCYIFFIYCYNQSYVYIVVMYNVYLPLWTTVIFQLLYLAQCSSLYCENVNFISGSSSRHKLKFFKNYTVVIFAIYFFYENCFYKEKIQILYTTQTLRKIRYNALLKDLTRMRQSAWFATIFYHNTLGNRVPRA